MEELADEPPWAISLANYAVAELLRAKTNLPIVVTSPSPIVHVRMGVGKYRRRTKKPSLVFPIVNGNGLEVIALYCCKGPAYLLQCAAPCPEYIVENWKRLCRAIVHFKWEMGKSAVEIVDCRGAPRAKRELVDPFIIPSHVFVPQAVTLA